MAVQVLAMRLGHAAPDFMLSMNLKGVLPVDFFTAANLKPGRLHASCHPLLRAKDGKAETFEIRPGFHLVLCTCFNKDQWREYLRGKIPMGEVQPVQVCKSTAQVALGTRVG